MLDHLADQSEADDPLAKALGMTQPSLSMRLRGRTRWTSRVLPARKCGSAGGL